MPNLIETLPEAGFATLTRALETTGLSDVLHTAGPFTLLAPSDAAFSTLDQAVLNKLLADQERLNNLLRYHLLGGRYTFVDLAGLSTVTTLEGSELQVDGEDGVRLDEASVVEADIEADNGLIHVLDQVMLPEKYLY
jgi:uncharacterized surface protein with fasciclin (FAS1) repeats